MADSKELIIIDSAWSPEFIQDLLPSAERTALNYHLSFLCLSGFPELECLIRERAVETQKLFNSSEAVLMKCVGTSSNLVTSLFPMLQRAVEQNKPNLAVTVLEKARAWIDDIIREVYDIEKRYDEQNKSVASCTSDVFQEQKQTEEKLTKHSDEMKALEDELAKPELEKKTYTDEIKKNEKKIEETTSELQELIKKHEKEKKKCLYAFRNFFRGSQDVSKIPGVFVKKDELSRLSSEKDSLRNIDSKIKIQQTDLQSMLATSKKEMGVIPSPVHLKEVQQCLFQIQQILVELKKFWEKVGVMLDTMEENNFAGEELVDMEGQKDEFLNCIEEAGKYWQRFGVCTQRAQAIFSVQSKDAYQFLAINPSSLSEEDRNKQYVSIMEKLKKINPQGSSTAAITE